MAMQIIDRNTIEQAPWPASLAAGTRAMLSALVREGTQAFIANVQAEVRLIFIDQYVLPLVIVDRQADPPNAYVCSPTTHYIDYTLREMDIELADQPLLRSILRPVVNRLRWLMRYSKAERAVYVNNWLLSTNLYPERLSLSQLQRIHLALLGMFPDHAIIYRSLNQALNQSTIENLEQLGYQRVFSRQIYLLDPRSGAHRKRNSYGNDRRLSQNTTYCWHENADLAEHAERMRQLYTYLYIDKYSHYNPQLTDYFMQSAISGNWLSFHALERDGKYDAVIAYMQHHHLITAPVVGYDPHIAKNEGLYRLLMFDSQRVASQKQLILHLSSGAADFKRARGAEAQTEFSLIYLKHLPKHRHLVWNILAKLSDTVIIPIMQKFQL
jgi:hypothetical protein